MSYWVRRQFGLIFVHAMRRCPTRRLLALVPAAGQPQRSRPSSSKASGSNGLGASVEDSSSLSWGHWDWELGQGRLKAAEKGIDVPSNSAEREASAVRAAGLAVSSLEGDRLRHAIELLRPCISEQRLATFEHVLSLRTSRLRFVFERPTNPNNVWACLRTLDSFGIQHVHTIAAAAEGDVEAAEEADQLGDARDSEASFADHNDGRETKAQRRARMSAAMGSQKWLSFHEHADADDAVATLKAEGYTIVATDLQPGAEPFAAIDWAGGGRHAIVMGNEWRGIGPRMRELADRCEAKRRATVS